MGESGRVTLHFTRYAGVAILSFVLDYSTFLTLSYMVGLHYLLAHVLSRAVSGVFNFMGNRHFVFRSSGGVRGEAIGYATAVAFSMSATAAMLYVLVGTMGVSRALAKPLAESTMFYVNFMVLRRLIFGSDHGRGLWNS